MSISDWLTMVGIVSGWSTALWILLRKDIMRETDIKINEALNKIKDEKIKELNELLQEERHKSQYLKEAIKDLK